MNEKVDRLSPLALSLLDMGEGKRIAVELFGVLIARVSALRAVGWADADIERELSISADQIPDELQFALPAAREMNSMLLAVALSLTTEVLDSVTNRHSAKAEELR